MAHARDLLIIIDKIGVFSDEKARAISIPECWHILPIFGP
jgi:hypothetical protein